MQQWTPSCIQKIERSNAFKNLQSGRKSCSSSYAAALSGTLYGYSSKTLCYGGFQSLEPSLTYRVRSSFPLRAKPSQAERFQIDAVSLYCRSENGRKAIICQAESEQELRRYVEFSCKETMIYYDMPSWCNSLTVVSPTRSELYTSLRNEHRRIICGVGCRLLGKSYG